jgi:hypothetical protein
VVYKQTIALWHTVTFEATLFLLFLLRISLILYYLFKDKGRFTVSEEDLDLSSTINTHAGLVCIYHEEGFLFPSTGSLVHLLTYFRWAAHLFVSS